MTAVAELHRLWRSLPVGELDDIIGYGQALILAPHQDDESLGCGGLIAACVAAGRMPMVAFLTDGGRSHASETHPYKTVVALREREACHALRILGVPSDRIIFMRQPDGGAECNRQSTAKIARVAVRCRCSCILSTWRFDPHCDHAVASRIASKAAQWLRIRHAEYPIWGWMLPPGTTVDAPISSGYRLNITAYVALKSRAIAAHQSQLGRVIKDDPDAFAIPKALLDAVSDEFETYLFPSPLA